MQCVSFDAYRTLNLSNVQYIKPSHTLKHKADIQAADWVLFPEYWQLGGLLFGLKSRIFPSLATYLLGHDKVEMTRAFSVVTPNNIPYTVIEPNTPSGAERAWEAMSLPFVAKIPKSSMGQGVFLIDSRQDWKVYLEKTDVIYVQEYLPIDRDLRIVIVGDEYIAGFWRLQGHDGFKNNLSQGGMVDISPIPQAAIDLALELARTLGIDHAGFDIAMVGGHPYVIEFNRLFGNTGLPELPFLVSDAIQRYLDRSASQSHISRSDLSVSPFGDTSLVG